MAGKKYPVLYIYQMVFLTAIALICLMLELFFVAIVKQ
jgi:hypothetical protein